MCLALIVSRVFAYCYCRLVRPLFEKPVPSSESTQSLLKARGVHQEEEQRAGEEEEEEAHPWSRCAGVSGAGCCRSAGSTGSRAWWGTLFQG